MVERRNLIIKRRCMRCLYSYGYVKQKSRAKDMKSWKQRVKVLRNKVFEGLQWYIRYNRMMIIKKKACILFNIQRLQRKGLFALHKNKLINSYARDVIRTNQLNYLQRHLFSWYELFIERQG
jgi:hypothetical protein